MFQNVQNSTPRVCKANGLLHKVSGYGGNVARPGRCKSVLREHDEGVSSQREEGYKAMKGEENES